MKKRLAVTAAALLLAAQMGDRIDAAEPTIDQLTLISSYIEGGDIEALIVFLLENPELMEGDSAIARRLGHFMEKAQDLSTYLAFDPPLRTALAEGFWEEEQGSSLY